MSDWNLPTDSEQYQDVITEIKDRDESVLKMLDGTSETNLPVNSKRVNSSNDDKLERFDGSSWSQLEFHDIIDFHIADTSIHFTMPPGSILLYAGNSVPSGFLACNGAAVSRTTYANLFSAIGTLYGVGNGSTTFNLPNCTGKLPIGVDVGVGAIDTLGKSLGSLNHTHTTPNHQHTIASHDHTMAHTHTGGSHSHVLNDHQHIIPAHYHALDGSGADCSITGGGRHNHYISVRSGSGDTVITSNNKQYARVPDSVGIAFAHDLTDFDKATSTQEPGPSHTHAHSTMTGTVGNASSGNDGDSSSTLSFGVNGGPGSTQSGGAVTTSGSSASNTGGSGTLTSNTGEGGGTSGTGNPPMLVFNYIIKT